MHVCLSVSPTPASPFSARFVSSLSIFLSPSLHSRSLCPASPRPTSSFSPRSCLFFPSLSSFFRHLFISLPLRSLLRLPAPPFSAPRRAGCEASGKPRVQATGTVPEYRDPSAPRAARAPAAPRPSHLPAGRVCGAQTMATLSWPRTGSPRRVAAGRTLLVAAREESQRPRSRSGAFGAG